MKPLVFRLWLDKCGGDYFLARLHASQQQMWDAFEAQERRDHRDRRSMNRPALEQANALCSWRNYWFKSKHVRRHRLRHRGNLFLWIGGAGSGTVTHECVHAAAYWLTNDRRVDIRPGRPGHERLAFHVGRLVAQYWACWHRAKAAGRIRAVGHR